VVVGEGITTIEQLASLVCEELKGFLPARCRPRSSPSSATADARLPGPTRDGCGARRRDLGTLALVRDLVPWSALVFVPKLAGSATGGVDSEQGG
jgi:hypothetical protein